jgi:hypothetical protein
VSLASIAEPIKESFFAIIATEIRQKQLAIENTSEKPFLFNANQQSSSR